MACTTCTSTCACAVVGTSPVTVTGSGSGADPYRVAVDLCTALADLTNPGRDATPGDLLPAISAGGACELVTFPSGESIFQATAGDGITITPGDDPARTAGNGHRPEIDARLSTDAGNATTFGGDTGIFTPDLCTQVAALAAVPGGVTIVGSPGIGNDGNCYSVPPAAAETNIAVTDTNSVNLTASGTANHTIQADVRVGCGLVIDGSGVRVNTLSWTYPCADTNGTAIVCDANGNLRGAPEHTCVQGGRNGNVFTFLNTAANAVLVGPTVTSTINNPSPCRSMVVYADYSFGMNISGAFASRATCFLNVLSGPSYAGTFGQYEGNPANFMTGDNQTMTVTLTNNDVGTLAAGGSLSAIIRPDAVLNGPANSVTLTATSLLWGCTQ